MFLFTTAALKVLGSALLVAFSAISAGLEVALFSIDSIFLRVWSSAGTDEQKRWANELMGFFNHYHYTLVSLILFNSCCMMSLPIVLDTLVSPMTALILSVTVVLFVGEVIPLAFFVRHAVYICTLFAPLMRAVVVISTPISYPVSLLLDRILGSHEELLDRDELAAFILPQELCTDDGMEAAQDTPSVAIVDPYVHGKPESLLLYLPEREFGDSPVLTPMRRGNSNLSLEEMTVEGLQPPCSPYAALGGGGTGACFSTSEEDAFRLRKEEVRMLTGAMRLTKATVIDHMQTRTENIFMLSSQQPLDATTVSAIIQSGFSRIPVFFGDNPRHVIGALIVHSLVKLCFASPDPPPLVGNYPLREVMRLPESAKLYDAYLAFREGSSNMAVIYNSLGVMTGLLTLTDVLSALYLAPLPAEDTSGNVFIQRRTNKMVNLVESMKFLSQSKHINSIYLSGDTRRDAASQEEVDATLQ